ncbi:MAG TPA: winged helix-turn-helix domain-containing protein [Candidatus Nanoarchaeia archaeon]|nr:winged helix-turn-helix domain-containing protein [Candidatus Nanoarchaeia archaeon]
MESDNSPAKVNEKRDKIEIVYDILSAVEKKGGKIKPTHLLYKANLSHQRMKKYLAELLEKGLLTEENDNANRWYTLTEKGAQFIAEYTRIRKFTESFGL